MYILYSKRENFVSLYLAIKNYCDSATVPSVNNSQLGTLSTTVNAVSYYTCNTGYTSTSSVYVICTAYNITNGAWTLPTATCKCE